MEGTWRISQQFTRLQYSPVKFWFWKSLHSEGITKSSKVIGYIEIQLALSLQQNIDLSILICILLFRQRAVAGLRRGHCGHCQVLDHQHCHHTIVPSCFMTKMIIVGILYIFVVFFTVGHCQCRHQHRHEHQCALVQSRVERFMEEGGGGSSGRGEEKYKEFENQRKSDRDIDSEYQILCI